MLEKSVQQKIKEMETKIAQNEESAKSTPTDIKKPLMSAQQKEDQAAAAAKEPAQVAQVQENQEDKISKASSPKVLAAAAATGGKPPAVWDCGSTLYDSFELKSFERQLDSAIHSRTLSMPHLSSNNHHRQPATASSDQPVQVPALTSKKSPSKISRSIQKLLRSVFKPNKAGGAAQNGGNKNNIPSQENGFYVDYHDKSSRALSTIPEVSEFDGLSPDYNKSSLVRRTASDRFTFNSNIGISCA